jgi:AmmeMemoRadiSam system protein A
MAPNEPAPGRAAPRDRNRPPEGYAILPAIARASIAAALAGRPPAPPAPTTPALAEPAAVFVTLRKHGDLRGCIGSMSPLQGDLCAEVDERARAAAFEDPRFPSLEADELAACRIEVSVLGPLEAVRSAGDLDPRRYGVEVADEHGRRGVLLPDLDGVDSVEQQLAIARRKAGIPPEAAVSVRRFEVLKVAEP